MTNCVWSGKPFKTKIVKKKLLFFSLQILFYLHFIFILFHAYAKWNETWYKMWGPPVKILGNWNESPIWWILLNNYSLIKRETNKKNKNRNLWAAGQMVSSVNSRTCTMYTNGWWFIMQICIIELHFLFVLIYVQPMFDTFLAPKISINLNTLIREQSMSSWYIFVPDWDLNDMQPTFKFKYYTIEGIY